jgi:hypothetical protein
MAIHNNGLICVLASDEAQAFQHHGAVPPWTDHRHISKSKAEALITEGTTMLNDEGNYIRLQLAAGWARA